ncbi:MAG: B12-binding domain-containing radical SAM protein [Proteobacteria bacterium]|nr:B12-binding domain-containing radical SAM protein [Pseudomonadota bacterium]
MPDILLIQPPIRDFYLTTKRTIPYGLSAIAATLIDAGFSVTIIDMLATKKSKPIDLQKNMTYLNEYYGRADVSPFALFHQFRHFGYSYEHLKHELKKCTPFLIGISSLFTAYSDEALTCAKIAKEIHPQAKIVLGGHHPTALPEYVMQHNFIDYCIRGEGEVSLSDLAICIKTKKSPETIPGIVFRKKGGHIHVSEPALMKEPDAYPLPASHLIKSAYYQRGKGSAISIMTGRGCPMTCSYCSMGAFFRHYRKRSVNHVMAELSREASERNARFIDFEDENLSLDRKWFITLLERIIQTFGENHLELRAMNGLFPPSLDEELITLMKMAGFKTLNLSLGSTDLNQLKRFNRPDVREKTDHILNVSDKLGLETVCYIIAGAPGQTATSSMDDLLYLSHRKALVGVSIYYPAPGSLDYDFLEASGNLPGSFSLMRSTAIPVDNTTSRLESVTLLRLARIINFIKALKAKGEEIPKPHPYKTSSLKDMSDRTALGKQILSWFFHDGKIRGIEPGGLIYEHAVSKPLTKGFIENFESAPQYAEVRNPNKTNEVSSNQ